jgi:hypothetical protein
MYKNVIFYLLIILLSLLLVNNEKIYNEQGIKIVWTDDDELNIDIPNNFDCLHGCKDNDADRCNIGICFELCYDKDRDFQISVDEVQRAIDKKLSWYEKMATYSAKDWVKKFDGKDGTKIDNKISPVELHTADVSCSDLGDMMKHLVINFVLI